MTLAVLSSLLSLQLVLTALSPGAAETTHPTGESDGELVRLAQGGDRRSQGLLYQRHAPKIARRASRLLGRSGEAEDVLQDAFVEAFRDLAQLQDPQSFSPWLMRIATHQIHRRFRKRDLLRRLGMVSSDESGLEALVDPTASPELRVQCAQLDTALSSLPPRERIAWTLRYVEGCQLEEVASLTETSLATVKRHLLRAHEKVQRHFAFSLSDESTRSAPPALNRSNERASLARGASS